MIPTRGQQSNAAGIADDALREARPLQHGAMGPDLDNAYLQLLQALRQKDEKIVSLALAAFADIEEPDKDWVEELRKILPESLPSARRFAAETLALLGTDALAERRGPEQKIRVGR